MRLELLEVLRCPRSGTRLEVQNAEYVGAEIRSGVLISANGDRYPIRAFIPRFVPESNYADNFGMQWNAFRKTQLDSHSTLPISGNRFWKATGWSPAAIKSKWVLDAGCGAGRFAEIALTGGANVVALDYSSAVDACSENLGHHPNLHIVQGDIYALPFAGGSFPFVYSLGVLQHTPDVARAFAALPPMVAPGGQICVDFYWKRFRSVMQAKYVVRPITRRIPKSTLFSALKTLVPIALPISQGLGRVPVIGKALKRFIPVADYTGVYPLSEAQLKEWALLDTFDMLAPEFDSPQSVATVTRWMESAGLTDIAVFHEGHLVGRGRVPS